MRGGRGGGGGVEGGGRGRYRNKSQHRKLTPGEDNSPAARDLGSNESIGLPLSYSRSPLCQDAAGPVSLPFPRLAWDVSEAAGNLFALLFSQSSSSFLVKACISGVSEHRYAFFFSQPFFFSFQSPLQVPSFKPAIRLCIFPLPSFSSLLETRADAPPP